MRLLPLHNDYIFKALFVRNPDILLDLINALPQFTGEHKVTDDLILGLVRKQETPTVLKTHCRNDMGMCVFVSVWVRRGFTWIRLCISLSPSTVSKET